jgi:DNA-nicking Smr family endonuclease
VRRLSAEEQRLWGKVVESVRPLRPAPETPIVSMEAIEPPPPAPLRPRIAAAPPPPPPKGPGTTLDRSWDRRLGRGSVQPDLTLDLHGHDLDRAWRLLDSRLETAIASGARILLLITGKPPGAERPVARGRIRAAVGDWLAASRHAGDIAAVRGAHPRHGGAGALYIVLRRRKPAQTKS